MAIKEIDPEDLNNFLKEVLPKDRLTSFERNFVAYKITEWHNQDSLFTIVPKGSNG